MSNIDSIPESIRQAINVLLAPYNTSLELLSTPHYRPYPSNELLSYAEAGNILGVTVRTVQRMADAGQLKRIKAD